MFLATVPRTRAVSPAFRSFDGNFERFINEAFSTGTRNQTGIEQDDKQWTLSLDVPGVSAKS
jgi:HSP20 family protein